MTSTSASYTQRQTDSLQGYSGIASLNILIRSARVRSQQRALTKLHKITT